MISDKSMSLPLSELLLECQKGSIGASYKRNVILQWLNTSYNNPSEFLEQIDKHGFNPDESVVGVHPKERELKIQARMFGLLTLEKRLYVVVTEAMLADYIFPYFPEITMNYDAVSLQTRIHNNTIKQGKRSDNSNSKKIKRTVVINMDFEKWNTYMREDETKGIFQDFDHLFGLNNVFQRTHSMFSESQLYLADGTITPFNKHGAPHKKGVWKGHLGGIEGLRQKGWTIFTVVILKYIAEITGSTQCQIMGQGDNQVMILDYEVENEHELKDLHSQFMKSLNYTLKMIGPPLKLEETWSLSNFFIYGKFPVFEGKPLSMSLKKLCRTMRLTNEGLQNLESTLSSITANASAATASDLDPTIPYIVGTFETVGAIRLHLGFPFYSPESVKVKKNSMFRVPINGVSSRIALEISSYYINAINSKKASILIAIALLPCILGGYPTLQLCDLLNHGFPDPLSLNIWSLKQFFLNLKESDSKLKTIITFILNPIFNQDVNPEMLCLDPVSINLLKSSSGSEKIKRMVFEFLTTQAEVQNPHFSTFLVLAKNRQTELCKLLSSMNPLNPRVINSIISSTITGRAMQVISKINKTGTIIGLMIRSRAAQHEEELEELLVDLDLESHLPIKHKQIGELFGKFEENHLLSILYLLFHPRGIETTITHELCSTQLAQDMREKSWNLPITGVTVAVPQEFLCWIPADGSDCIRSNHPTSDAGYILLRSAIPVAERTQYTFDPLNLPAGPFKPFFGSKTKNKVKYEGGELKNCAPPISRMFKL